MQPLNLAVNGLQIRSLEIITCFPFCQLPKTLLSGPHGSVNDFQEKLASSWIENEDGSIDWLCCQVTFECLQIKTFQNIDETC